MNNLVLRRFDMFKRVAAICNQYPAIFPGGTYSGNLHSALSEVIKNLSEYFTEQTTQMDAAKTSYISKAAIKNELLEEIKPLRKYARIIGRKIPGIEEKFNISDKLSEQELLSKARGIAATAATHEQEFMARDMTPDFLAQLNMIIEAYAEAIDERVNATGAHIAATTGIDLEIEKGMDLIEEIGAVIEAKAQDNKVIMQAWRSARHVEKARITSKSPKPPEAPPEQ